MLNINITSFPRTDAAYPYFSSEHNAWFDLIGWDHEDDFPIIAPRFYEPAGDTRPRFWEAL